MSVLPAGHSVQIKARTSKPALVTVRFANDAKPEQEIDAEALVDTGALHLCIPEHVAAQLQLSQKKPREVITADGKSHVVPYVSPVRNGTTFRGTRRGKSHKKEEAESLALLRSWCLKSRSLTRRISHV